MVLGVQEKVFWFQITVNHLMTVCVCVCACACICVCMCACMHARMCVYYMYMLYRYMYGDAALSKKDRNSKMKITFLI